MVSLFVANSNWIRLSFRIFPLLICMQTFTIRCNILCWMNRILHTYVIKNFGRSGRNLLPIRMQTSVLHSKSYLEAGSIWLLLRNLWNNIVASIPYTFGITLRSFYGTINFSIPGINTYTTLANIFMESQSSATLIIKYLINEPLESKLIFTKLHIYMGPLLLPHNHIKFYWLNLPYLGWTLTN